MGIYKPYIISGLFQDKHVSEFYDDETKKGERKKSKENNRQRKTRCTPLEQMGIIVHMKKHLVKSHEWNQSTGKQPISSELIHKLLILSGFFLRSTMDHLSAVIWRIVWEIPRILGRVMTWWHRVFYSTDFFIVNKVGEEVAKGLPLIDSICTFFLLEFEPQSSSTYFKSRPEILSSWLGNFG